MGTRARARMRAFARMPTQGISMAVMSFVSTCLCSGGDVVVWEVWEVCL